MRPDVESNQRGWIRRSAQPSNLDGDIPCNSNHIKSSHAKTSKAATRLSLTMKTSADFADSTDSERTSRRCRRLRPRIRSGIILGEVSHDHSFAVLFWVICVICG